MLEINGQHYSPGANVAKKKNIYEKFQPAYYEFFLTTFVTTHTPAPTAGASADAWFTYHLFDVYCKRWQPIGVKTLPKMQRYLPGYYYS